MRLGIPVFGNCPVSEPFRLLDASSAVTASEDSIQDIIYTPCET